MKRAGFAYTLFAMLIVSLVFALTVMPTSIDRSTPGGTQLRVDEVSYFLDSARSDLDRATRIISRRTLSAVTNHVVNAGSYLDDAEPAFGEAFVNGTVNGTASPVMADATIVNWTTALQAQADDAAYMLNVTTVDVTVGVADEMRVAVNATFHLNLSDPVSRTRFDRDAHVRIAPTIADVEDPLILVESNGQYSNAYSSCRRDQAAVRHATGTDRFYRGTQNWTAGTAVTRPGNQPVTGVADKDEKVVAVADLCSYTDLSPFTQFRGVVSERPAIDATTPNSRVDVCGQDDVNLDAVIDDAANATHVGNGTMSVMTDTQYWQNNLANWTAEGCYFPDPWAPSFWGRLEGRTDRAGYSHGPAFLLTVPDLPAGLQATDRSAVASVYFDPGSHGPVSKVKGVTDQDRDWFRLDQDHIDHWGINALAYD